MPTAIYAPPVDNLLTYGNCHDLPDWPNYLALGFTDAHVPDLIRMALDEGFDHEPDDSLAIWAPIHAWRALGQLRAESAAEPLTHLFQRIDTRDDDWVGEQLPVVYGMIGAVAIPTLQAYLADAAHGFDARIAAAQSLSEIARQHPAARDACVAALSHQLERFIENDATLNAFLIHDLTELKAVESAAVIEQAFTFNRVDTMIMGDWEDAQIALGLKAGRERPRETTEWDQLVAETAPALQREHVRPAKDKAKAKAKRKQATKSRQKNRKRK